MTGRQERLKNAVLRQTVAAFAVDPHPQPFSPCVREKGVLTS